MMDIGSFAGLDSQENIKATLQEYANRLLGRRRGVNTLLFFFPRRVYTIATRVYIVACPRVNS